MPKGRDLVAWLLMMAVACLSIAYGITGSERLLGIAVVIIGTFGLIAAAHGKPAFVVGLVDRLLLMLPDRVWRALMAIGGIAIMAMGAVFLVLRP